ncbi:hypothetical protein Goari_005166 [Gossypium aridum]|uniref:Uncharacterized protein n=1 Tax=Gossypium aridum TaxID=34290 RepID=A0A7J8Y5Q2_GOSAI|nr:hypothetical protein [Gossypium aridum]
MSKGEYVEREEEVPLVVELEDEAEEDESNEVVSIEEDEDEDLFKSLSNDSSLAFLI